MFCKCISLSADQICGCTCLAEGKCLLVEATIIIVYKDHPTVIFIVKQYVTVNGVHHQALYKT